MKLYSMWVKGGYSYNAECRRECIAMTWPRTHSISTVQTVKWGKLTGAYIDVKGRHFEHHKPKLPKGSLQSKLIVIFVKKVTMAYQLTIWPQFGTWVSCKLMMLWQVSGVAKIMTTGYFAILSAIIIVKKSPDSVHIYKVRVKHVEINLRHSVN